MTLKDRIINAIESMAMGDVAQLWNNFCDSASRMDDYVYDMDLFDEICDGMKPWEVARAAFYGNFCPAHNYFWFNGSGNIESDDWLLGSDSPVCVSEIADYVIDNEDALYNDEIEDILAMYVDDDYEDEED